MTDNSYYLTTPIYYVNSVPHLGTAYTTIAADALARYRRMCGDDVLFLTGLDEHGQKVAQAAEQNGTSPQAWVDSVAPKFLETWTMLDISNDDFIRTTEERHVRGSQVFLQALKDNGDIRVNCAHAGGRTANTHLFHYRCYPKNCVWMLEMLELL